MPSGLVALLDDIAGITKLAAASIDDIGAAAGKAGTKAAGVVIDDTAVTPSYVTGFHPERELPIIWRIARGSLKNKLLYLLPAALLLSAFAPWAITPILMVGGAYLCFEGVEKLAHKLQGHHGGEEALHAAEAGPVDHAVIEEQKIGGAIRTDLILSAEIMAIALAELTTAKGGPEGAAAVGERVAVTTANVLPLAASLALVALAVTVGVYGVVALIVKMDDIGLHLAKRPSSGVAALGRGLVRFMPVLLGALSALGTAAMIWVGGGIIVHGAEEYHLTGFPEWLHHFSVEAGQGAPFAGGFVEWLVFAIGAGFVGLIVGGLVVAGLHFFKRGKTSDHGAQGAQI
jgi:predicted DNA repair protein MutK